MTDRVKHTWNNIKDVLLNEQTEILKVAGLLMLPTILTKITGQLFSLLAAARLDAKSDSLREFLVASDLPETLTNIVLLGVISAVVIPILIDVKNKHGRERFLRVYNTIINVSVLLFLAVTVLIIIFAQDALLFFITYISRPDNLPAPDSLERIVSMMRVMMFPNLILGVSAFVASGLNVYQRFLVPQLAPLFYNVGRIFGVFVLLPLLHESPWALVMGTFLGALLHLFIQIPLVRHLQLGYRPVIDLADENVRKLFRVALPRTLALAIDEVGLTIVNFVAFGLNALARGSLFYATSLATVIPSLFGFTFAVASFPTLTQLYLDKEYFRVNELIIKTLNQIVFLAMPLVAAMMILRLPLVRLTYGLIPGTEFDRESTAAVAWVLLFFTFGMIFWAYKWYLYRIFYVAQNTFVPLVISAVSLITTIVLSIVFSNLFSHSDAFSIGAINFAWENLFSRSSGRAAIGGISLALSCVYILESMLLLFLADRLVVKLNWREFFSNLLRKLVPTVSMMAVMYGMYKMWDNLAFPIDATPGFAGSTTLNLLILTGITVGTSFMIYYLMCFFFQVEDLKILRRFLNPLFRIGGLSIK